MGLQCQALQGSGPVALASNATRQEVGVGPDPHRVTGIARSPDQFAATRNVLLHSGASPINVSQREKRFRIAPVSVVLEKRKRLGHPARLEHRIGVD